MTKSELKKILRYDPETGIFIWLVSRSCKRNIGDIAGHKNKNGYVKINIKGTLYYAHRLAFLYMTGKYPSEDVDHIDGDKHNNRWSNLRSATRSQNICNRGPTSKNSTGFKGVTFDKRRNKFIASGTINKKTRHLGRFDTPQEAYMAYTNFVRKAHGEYFYETNKKEN